MNNLVMARLQKSNGQELSERSVKALKEAGEWEEPKKAKKETKSKKTEVIKVKQAVSKKKDVAVKSKEITKG